MKKIILLPLLSLLLACGGNKQDKIDQLAEYKSELASLKKDISKLEEELADTSENSISVLVRTIKPTSFKHHIDITGYVKSDYNILVSSETPGKVESINVKEGQWVDKGQILGSVNAEIISQSIIELKANLELATSLFEKQRELWDNKIGSEVQYLQAKTQKESLESRIKSLQAQRNMAIITSPISGIVDEVFSNIGEISGPSVPFARIVNLNDIYVVGDLSEAYLTAVKANDRVDIEFPVLNKVIEAKISRRSEVIDANSRTFRIRADIKNMDKQIKPNLMSIMKVTIFSADSVIVIPALLAKKDFSGEFVFIAQEKDGKTIAAKKYITSGITSNNSMVILDGLLPGMKLITEGYTKVVDGSVLSIQ